MTWNEGQGHSNWYQTIALSGVYYHTIFERNLLVNVQRKSVLKFFKHHLFVLSLKIDRQQRDEHG